MRRGTPRLTEDQVAAIKLRLEAGDTQEHLAYVYGVSQPVISAIKTGNAWQDVKPLPAKYDPTIATDPVTLETVFLPPEPKPLPRWDGASIQQSRRAALLQLEGAGIRPCLTATSQWIGCPYPGSETLCPATERPAGWLACILKPGEHKIPVGYYPPEPKVSRVLAAAKQSDEDRRRKHTNAVTVEKAKKPGRFAALQVSEPKRIRQYLDGKWKTRIFVNGRWEDEPDHQEPQSTAG